MKNLLITLLLISYAFILSSANWYVDGTLGTDASGYGTGTGVNAFKTINYAVNYSGVSGGDYVYVAEGTYSENISYNKELKLIASNGDPEKTIIEGVSTNAPVISVSNISSYSFVARIKGFTIRNGNAANGGGVYLYNIGTNFYLKNLIITDNNATNNGGGVYMEKCQYGFFVDDVKVSYNTATVDGGGMYVKVSDVTIRNSEFETNVCDGDGAGIYYWADPWQTSYSRGYTIVLQQSEFKDNRAASEGGGVFVTGGVSSAVVATAEEVDFEDNYAGEFGGGLYVQSGDEMDVIECNFELNKAANGGGIYSLTSFLNIYESWFEDNVARTGNGGGYYASISTLQLENSILTNNIAGSGDGGGAYYEFSGGEIIHATVADNSSSGAGKGMAFEESYVDVYNSIYWHNGATQIEIILSGQVEFFNCNVEEGSTTGITPVYSNFSTNNNIEYHPQFLDHDRMDYHLRNFSPNIGAAQYILSDDYEGNIRYTEGPDIGAFENSLNQPEDAYYVDNVTGSNTNSGTEDWPFLTIQYGMTQACNNNIKYVAVLPTGTAYSENNLTIPSNPSVELQVIGSSGPYETEIDGNAANSVFNINSNSNPVVIDGFTINNGYDNDGGGIQCTNSNLGIINSIVVNNVASNSGGGISANSSTVEILRSQVSYNEADHGGGIFLRGTTLNALDLDVVENIVNNSGGGIYGIDQSILILSNVSISGHSGVYNGAGMYIDNMSTLDISGSEITNNIASNGGGGILMYDECDLAMDNTILSENESGIDGGGLCLWSCNNIQITNSTFTDNACYSSSHPGAGGMFVDGYYSQTNVVVENSEFGYNYADIGSGGIFLIYDVDFTGNNLYVHHNDCNYSGGGICADDGILSLELNNCLVANNTANLSGGGIFSLSSNTVLNNNTICYNTASTGAGLYVDQTYGYPYTVTNSILWGNSTTVQAYPDPDNNSNYFYSDIQNISTLIQNNINNDPLFVTSGANGDYHVRYNTSPCIDAGDPSFTPSVSTDLDGNSRVNNIIDMGAYENDGSNSAYLRKGIGNAQYVIENTDFSIKAYPSPVEKILHIQVDSDVEGTVEISLINLTGQVVKNVFKGSIEENLKISTNVDDLSSGFYICTVKINNSPVKVAKFIKE